MVATGMEYWGSVVERTLYYILTFKNYLTLCVYICVYTLTFKLFKLTKNILREIPSKQLFLSLWDLKLKKIERH